MSTLQDVKGFLLSASKEEVEQVQAVARMRMDQIGMINAVSFQNGDRVKFDGGRGRGMIYGSFQGIARKNALVKDDRGMNWRVSPQLLKPE
jgi:co-chaperonin GroES (HSP10)